MWKLIKRNHKIDTKNRLVIIKGKVLEWVKMGGGSQKVWTYSYKGSHKNVMYSMALQLIILYWIFESLQQSRS